MTAASKQEVLASLVISVLDCMKKSSFSAREHTNFPIVKTIERQCKNLSTVLFIVNLHDLNSGFAKNQRIKKLTLCSINSLLF